MRAYNKSAQSIEFFEFTRTMQAYKDMIGEGPTIMFSTNTESLQVLKGMNRKTTN